MTSDDRHPVTLVSIHTWNTPFLFLRFLNWIPRLVWGAIGDIDRNGIFVSYFWTSHLVRAVCGRCKERLWILHSAVYPSCEDLPVQLVAWGEETVLREKAQLFIASPLTRVELAAVEPTVLTVDLNPAKRPVLCPTTLHSCWHLGLNVLLSYVERLL